MEIKTSIVKEIRLDEDASIVFEAFDSSKVVVTSRVRGHESLNIFVIDEIESIKNNLSDFLEKVYSNLDKEK